MNYPRGYAIHRNTITPWGIFPGGGDQRVRRLIAPCYALDQEACAQERAGCVRFEEGQEAPGGRDQALHVDRRVIGPVTYAFSDRFRNLSGREVGVRGPSDQGACPRTPARPSPRADSKCLPGPGAAAALAEKRHRLDDIASAVSTAQGPPWHERTGRDAPAEPSWSPDVTGTTSLRPRPEGPPTAASNATPPQVHRTHPETAGVRANCYDHVRLLPKRLRRPSSRRHRARVLREHLHRWHPQVLRWARRRCVDPQEAEDVAQQVFADVWRYSGRYCPRRGEIGPWMYGITVHKAADASAAVGTSRS
ncbi:RNA polymerase sigma factor [Streptomyces sp. f150]|uniref:RNA polymerase sigma factor n=1 Tax=Streptomyces sp. f150 TaxID=1827699 RepID=UPI000BEF257D